MKNRNSDSSIVAQQNRFFSHYTTAYETFPSESNRVDSYSMCKGIFNIEFAYRNRKTSGQSWPAMFCEVTTGTSGLIALRFEL